MKKKKVSGGVCVEMETSMIISPDSKASNFTLLEEYESSVFPPDPVGKHLPPPPYSVVMSPLKKSLWGGRSACMVGMRPGVDNQVWIAWYL